jgi:hypothetical protein
MDECGRHYLTTVGTRRDIAESGIVLSEGQHLSFYDVDGTNTGERDDLLFEGIVHFDNDVKEWYAIIDPKSFRHQSDEDAFHQLSDTTELEKL